MADASDGSSEATGGCLSCLVAAACAAVGCGRAAVDFGGYLDLPVD